MTRQTDWNEVERWYDQLVGEKGHHYHSQVIFPKLLSLLNFRSFRPPRLLDLGCGQGVLARYLPPSVAYYGIDLSADLIKAAQKRNFLKKEPKQTRAHHAPQFLVGDICAPLALEKQFFSHATCILALQNVAEPAQALKQAAIHLVSGGVLALVLNHPCFRIPRQSSWGMDEQKKLQYRRIDRYMTPLTIPIQMQPSQGAASVETWSFHHSLSDYSRMLKEAGFFISLIEEWCSDKISTGALAKAANRARNEFPLFLTLLAVKESIDDKEHLADVRRDSKALGEAL